MLLPTVYIETTIPSYLTSRRSRDLRLAADQEATEEWWIHQRHGFVLFVSDLVLDEVSGGDAALAERRLATLAGIPSLDVTEEVDELAVRLLQEGLIPPKAAQDAFHVAVSAVHKMDFLLTWNCTHINNVTIIRRVERFCAQAGFACPVICSPNDFLPLSPP
jgi:hypothetical protein